MEAEIERLVNHDGLARKLVICVGRDWTEFCDSLISSIPKAEFLWCYSQRKSKKIKQLRHDRSMQITFQQHSSRDFASKILGQTYDAVFITDLRTSNPFANTIAQSIECVQKGGLVFIHFQKSSLYIERLIKIAFERTGSCLIIRPDSFDRQIESFAVVKKHKRPKDGVLETKEQSEVLESISENLSTVGYRNVHFVGAGRGRGKSALLGLAIGRFVVSGEKSGYIAVSGPSLESVKILFDFVQIIFERENLQFKIESEGNGRKIRVETDNNNTWIVEYVHPLMLPYL